jgi:hypothetical protein
MGPTGAAGAAAAQIRPRGLSAAVGRSMLSTPLPTWTMRPLLTSLALLPLLALPARAGSVTADSINDHSAALQAALQQVPRGASVSRSQCQSIQVGGFGLPRWRCTVWFSDTPAAQAPGQPGGGAPTASPAAPAP